MKHEYVLVVLVENRRGVLNKVVSLLRRRGFNIESLTVGHTETAGVSRITLSFNAENTNIDQVTRQLDRLIEVLQVVDITQREAVHRELALIKVKADERSRKRVVSLVDQFHGKIIDISLESIILEMVGAPQYVDEFLSAMEDLEILEMIRTGVTSMERGLHTARETISITS